MLTKDRRVVKESQDYILGGWGGGGGEEKCCLLVFDR